MEVSNADRVVFPDDGITKGAVVEYYESVGGRLLPFVAGRPITVERYPKGIGGKGFMQKNVPDHAPEDLVDRFEVPKEDGGTTVYPVIDSADGITFFANLGVITFHAPQCTTDAMDTPDWMVWDLDPTEGDVGAVREAAHSLRAMLSEFGVPTVVMTSGSKGYHLRTRLRPGPEFDDVSFIARATATLAATRQSELMTVAFRKAERGGRVFVDWLRNAPLSTAVAPWSLRARTRAPVATPIAWAEVDEVSPGDVTLGDIADRPDVWGEVEPVDVSDLPSVLQAALRDEGVELEPFDRFRS